MYIQRSDQNPIVTPNRNYSWQAEAVFNGCPVKEGDTTYLVYRALSLPHYHSVAGETLMVSEIGIAESFDGVSFNNHKRLIIPEVAWERFGCEDPRVTKLDGKYYIFYTALSEYPPRAEGIKVAVALSDDMKKVTEKHLVTPFNAKAMTIFPERINGKIWGILSVNTDNPPVKVCTVSFDNESDIWSEEYWQKWYKTFNKSSLPLQRRPEDHVEVGAQPLKTKNGWVLIYSYIKNYYSPNRLFGIEAVLLDLNDPTKIIGSTNAPFLTPEEYYERMGMIPDVIFPSGALIDDDTIHLYYGAADTTICLAYIKIDCLLSRIENNKKKTIQFKRYDKNPIISPTKHAWESKATLNPAAIKLDNKVHLIYRAISEDNTSVFGYASSEDGFHISSRSEEPIYLPRMLYESKLNPGGNSGCEDPRLTLIDDKIFMLYTAYDGINSPRVALTHISIPDFISQKWEWSKPVLISSPEIGDKDACIFPEKVGDNYLIIHRAGEDIDYSLSKNLDFDGKTWLEEYRWIGPRKGMWDDKKVGIASPPIKTDNGWILLYHGISSEDNTYRVGACLLDRDNPLKVISRLEKPIFEPETDYEKNGLVDNVVFPCGAVVMGDEIYIYYGGADKVIGVATINTRALLSELSTCMY